MLRLVRQIVNEETQLNNTADIDTIKTVWNDENNPNSTNGSSLISAFFSSIKKQGFSWEFNLNVIILAALGLIFVILLLGAGIWYWCNRAYRVRRQHSLPLAVDDFIETTKIQEKRLSSSPIINLPNQAPPVPPRPTAYTTVLGRVEYRSNL